MFESQGTTPAEQDSTAIIAELQTRVAGADNELELMTARYLRSEAIIETARRVIEEVLAGDIDSVTTFNDFREAFEELGVKATRQVEIEISVTWRGTVELPLGVEVDDLDVDDFGIEINGHNDYDSEIRSHFESYSIDER